MAPQFGAPMLTYQSCWSDARLSLLTCPSLQQIFTRGRQVVGICQHVNLTDADWIVLADDSHVPKVLAVKAASIHVILLHCNS